MSGHEDNFVCRDSLRGPRVRGADVGAGDSSSAENCKIDCQQAIATESRFAYGQGAGRFQSAIHDVRG
jgi:hypothetical protein